MPLVEARDEISKIYAAFPKPAVGANTTIAYVSPQDEAIRTVRGDPTIDEIRLRGSYTADSHHGSAGREGREQILLALDTAAEIHFKICGSTDFLQDRQIYAMLFLRSVEIHDVQTPQSQLFEMLGDIHWIVRISGTCIIIPFR